MRNERLGKGTCVRSESVTSGVRLVDVVQLIVASVYPLRAGVRLRMLRRELNRPNRSRLSV
jgi:hypothetical protein